ncbi:hypothetical protein EHS39_29330 [Ensifer sp. MPMI2T]|nr:hypothetical protein EHS39_29330 [Ensifer sp. MPMI2T]
MSSATKVVVANETGYTSNPGCRAVRRGISRLMELSDVRIGGALPLGFWANEFSELAPVRENWLIRQDGKFASGTEKAAPIDTVKWKQIRNVLLRRDDAFSKALEEVDTLVINGEGSLHHNFPRALALLAMISIAAERGKRVALLNSTIQAMDSELLMEVLPALGFCHVREQRTLLAIRDFQPSAFAAPDLAVLAMRVMEPPYRPRSQVDGKRILVSYGVLVNEKMLRALLRSAKGCGLEPIYLSIGDGGETALATRVCAEEGVPLVHAGEINFRRLLELLSSSALAVSGRHHINLFLMRCGVPILCIPSNTWKLDATFELSGYPKIELTSVEDIDEMITRAYENRHSLAVASREGFRKCASLIDELPERFRQWIC